MMNLAQASSYFDRTPVTDPYTGQLLFYGQVDPFEDSKRDSASAYRRVLSLAEDKVIPAHRCVRLFNTDWMVGSGELDGMAKIHRQKLVITQVNTELKVSTLTQYLAGTSARTLKAAAFWSKDLKQIDTSSEQPQMYDVFLPSDVPSRAVLWNDTQTFLCASSRLLPSGLVSAFSLKLNQPRETATVTSRVFSPVSGGYTTSASTKVSVLRVRWQSLFEYESQMDARYQEGDISVVLPTSPAVSSAAQIVFTGVTYSILGVDMVAGAQVAHCRRV